jgi:pSer/pThr/pTyr-binding forkhead associated (FHA) protein
MSVIISIGRQPDNDIIISETYISAIHAQLIMDTEGQWFIHDLESTNGTFVNGDRISGSARISENDQILIGGSVLSWQHIYQQYKKPSPEKQPAVKKYFSYLAGAAAVMIVFILFYLFNENTTYAATTTAINRWDESNPKGKKDLTQAIRYDLSCVTLADNKKVNTVANKVDSLYESYINNLDVPVSLDDEIEFGNKHHEELLKGSQLLNNSDSKHLENIVAQLSKKITNPRGFTYKVFLIDSKDVNSWTSGGRIYFTTGMLAFTRNDDEIAGILGHEIYHNELGHINKKLKVQKAAIQQFGNKKGGLISNINSIISTPFGKKDEAYCDLEGVDIIIAAGYNPCKVIDLWKRMGAQEETYDDFSNFLRSHPYASVRAGCIQNHLQTNYHIDCARYQAK